MACFRSSNIFDKMMEMMLKYANNLEQLVEERTLLLREEKKKSENLLLRILPKYVAIATRLGQHSNQGEGRHSN